MGECQRPWLGIAIRGRIYLAGTAKLHHYQVGKRLGRTDPFALTPVDLNTRILEDGDQFLFHFLERFFGMRAVELENDCEGCRYRMRCDGSTGSTTECETTHACGDRAH